MLGFTEFIAAGVVEGDEVDAVMNPVIPGSNGSSIGAILLALRGNLGAIEQRGELDDVGFARHGRDRLMVSATEEDGKGTERTRPGGPGSHPTRAADIQTFDCAPGGCIASRSWSGCDIQRKSPRCQ